MRLIRTLFALVFQLVQFVLLALWALVKGMARIVGLAGWKRVETGEEYEDFVAHYLKKRGYRVLQHPGGSGDMGVDLVVRKGLRTYAVQCKYYSWPVDGSAVQQVVAGMVCYDCDSAMVVTNSTLTPGAWTLAERNGVEVLDRVSPVDDFGALTLEGVLTPGRLGAFALGLLGTLLELQRMGGVEAVRADPRTFALHAGAFFLAAALGVWLLGLVWRLLTGWGE